MTRLLFGAVLLGWVGWQPLLAQDSSGQQSSPGTTQASPRDQQTPAGGSSATQSARPAESGPALPAPDGSTSGSNASAPKAQQEQSIVANSDRQTQASNNAQQPRNDRSVTTVGDERRDDTRGVRNNFPDRDAARDYRHPELPEPIQPAPADRERSYLTRAPRPLPVYFGAEFDSGVEGVALVTRVDRGSPADRAGLRQDDIVVSLNGEKVSSANDAMAILGSMRAGDRLDVEYSRQARVRAVLADSRDGAVATRSMQERVDVDRGYDDSPRRAYDSSYDTSRNDSSRDRPRTDPPRTERRGLGIFRRR